MNGKCSGRGNSKDVALRGNQTASGFENPTVYDSGNIYMLKISHY
jgi:hypothetical protein